MRKWCPGSVGCGARTHEQRNLMTKRSAWLRCDRGAAARPCTPGSESAPDGKRDGSDSSRRRERSGRGGRGGYHCISYGRCSCCCCCCCCCLLPPPLAVSFLAAAKELTLTLLCVSLNLFLHLKCLHLKCLPLRCLHLRCLPLRCLHLRCLPLKCLHVGFPFHSRARSREQRQASEPFRKLHQETSWQSTMVSSCSFVSL